MITGIARSSVLAGSCTSKPSASAQVLAGGEWFDICGSAPPDTLSDFAGSNHTQAADQPLWRVLVRNPAIKTLPKTRLVTGRVRCAFTA
jgi:hypothetical protein